MAHFFKDREGKVSRYWKGHSFFFVDAEKVEQDSSADLIVQVTRLDKARICDDSPSIKTDKISNFDPQVTRFFFIGHFFIQAHFHIVLGPLHSSRILVDMARGLVDKDSTRMCLSCIGHMDGTVFPFDHIPREATDTIQLETAIWFHGTDNSSQSIYMSRDVAVLLVIFTLEDDCHASLSCPNRAVAHVRQGLDQVVGHFFCIACR